ncbi:hypothetical protein ACQW5G_01590 [Fructilactobacillus sp. Tb1]|uniref:hypothetical protein n=1 Tax=Fructilactobacillus sp. Tb1 TaxID=3422304 RepID=UPI003D2C8496
MDKKKSDYTELLNQLRDGKISELTITPDEFFIFQQAFMDYETRKRIIGTAGDKGIVVYHYDNDN